jgi:hypothetical protein
MNSLLIKNSLFAAYGVVGILIAFGFAEYVQYLMEWEERGFFTALCSALAAVALWGEQAGTRRFIHVVVDRHIERMQIGEAKAGPIFGAPVDYEFLQGDDQPLPENLRYRVGLYIRRRKKADPHVFEKQLAAASSFNAFLRQEGRAGRL